MPYNVPKNLKISTAIDRSPGKDTGVLVVCGTAKDGRHYVLRTQTVTGTQDDMLKAGLKLSRQYTKKHSSWLTRLNRWIKGGKK